MAGWPTSAAAWSSRRSAGRWESVCCGRPWPRWSPIPALFGPLVQLGSLAKPLLPAALKAKVPSKRPAGAWPKPAGGRRMIALAGCVQSVATPLTNAAAARILRAARHRPARSPGAGCCGAAAYHLGAQEDALNAMRRNIDAWWPEIESGCEAILVSASGCGAVVKEYAEILAHDPDYAEKAKRVTALARDPVEVLAGEDLTALGSPGKGRKVAFHAPCSLQHGQQLKNLVEPILSRLGFELTVVPDAHLCCGSAGTYSITQPVLAKQLQANKVAALQSGQPELIATANIGCQLHIEAAADRPVVHWLELLDPGPEQ